MRGVFLMGWALLLGGCGTAVPLREIGTATGVVASRAQVALSLDRMVLETRRLAPVVAAGPGEFDNALAMNLPAAPIAALRAQLLTVYDRPLTFFKGWNPEGEAHVTVLTPVEFNRMRQGLPAGRAFTMTEIGELARSADLQQADLQVQGLGSGRATLEGRPEEVFFVIVESRALRVLRQQLHASYVARGGDPAAFDPAAYQPHITVGFTRRDLHLADGIIKDRAHSLDGRFRLELAAPR